MKKLFLICSVSFLVFGCKNSEEAVPISDIEETAQQIGDIMASMDEQGGDDGTVMAIHNFNYQKTFERFDQAPPAPVVANAMNLLVSPAQATACYTGGVGYGWGSTCTSRSITRSFQNCTIGLSATLSGDVTLTWGGTPGGTSCDWGGAPNSGSTITRVPNFVITGRRGATLAVTAHRPDGVSSTGQVLRYASGTSPNMVFNFTNDGIRRKFTSAASGILFDQTTTVASGTPIVVTGNSRTNRVMSGGFLTVTDTKNGVTCIFSPSNVTWNSATCNCAVQGSWSGSCDNGKSTTLTITGCGTGSYTEGDSTTSVTFDRCSSN